MKKLRTILTILLIISLTCILFSGCSNNNNSGGAIPSGDDTSQSSGGDDNKGSDKTTDSDKTADSDKDSSDNDYSDSGSDTGTYPVIDSYTAYSDAKTELLSKMMDTLSENPDTIFTSLELTGVLMLDLAMLPVLYFSVGEFAAKAGLSFMNASDIEYKEDGNNYTISYKDADGLLWVYEGTYDEASDNLSCKATKDGEDSIFLDFISTKYGYASQYYLIDDDGVASLYIVTIDGEGGYVGMSESYGGSYSPLSGSEPADLPAECDQWFAVSGDNLIGLLTDGTEIDLPVIINSDE